MQRHGNMDVIHIPPKLLQAQCSLVFSPETSIRNPIPLLSLMAANRSSEVLEAIKSSTPTKKPVADFDFSRTVEVDRRDPRCNPSQWPCMNKHVPAAPRANPHGQWVHCAQRNLRLQYTPRFGSPNSSTKSEDPQLILRALGQLQPLMEDHMPTAEVCLAMVKKIEAEEALTVLIQKAKTVSKGYKPKAKAKAKAPVSPARSSDSWEMTHSETPTMEDLEKQLTKEEMDQLTSLLRNRRAQHVQDQQAAQTAEEDLAQAYEQEMP